MTRLLYTLALGLVGAGIVHIGTLLLSPLMAGDIAWKKLSSAIPAYEVVSLDDELRRSISDQYDDPFFTVSVCRFDLSNGETSLRGPDTDLYWSLSVFDRNGIADFSYNESASSSGLDLAVVRDVSSPAQTSLTTVKSAIETLEGFVVVRIFAPDEPSREKAEGFLRSVKCQPGNS